MKRLLGTLAIALGACLVALFVGGWITKPPPLTAPKQAIPLTENLDQYLARTEAQAASSHPLTPGVEKRIVWAGAPGERTKRVLLNLHGFSATRQELAPVPERVAEALSANLFDTRLATHGRLNNGPMDASGEDWLEDGVEALAIGRALGDELIIMGTSTGATLAAALASHPDFALVTGLVFISPNFGPAAEGAGIATGPYGPQLTRAFAGEYRSWTAANEEQETFWTTRYPTSAIVEMMRLVELAITELPNIQTERALLIYSPKDDVVSVDKLLESFDALQADRKSVRRVDEPKSLSPHVLSGDILAPESVDETVAAIVAALSD
ncbi:MAG: alpha/beta fold hydrolase [Pseudomonadota bacterium]